VFANLAPSRKTSTRAEVVSNPSNTWGRDIDFEHTGMTTEEVYDDFPRLGERASQQAGTLSGGEQQMLAIARALKQSTDLLMLDEPYEGWRPRSSRPSTVRDDGTLSSRTPPQR